MGADYSRVTHPCAALLRAEAPFSLDLHVLGLPPAFVLSQDQTLQFDSLFIGMPQGASLSFFFVMLMHPRCLYHRHSLFRLALLLIALSSSIFKLPWDFIHPFGEVGLYAHWDDVSNKKYFFYKRIRQQRTLFTLIT